MANPLDEFIETAHAHEVALIRAFVKPSARRRLLGLFETPKRRPRLLEELADPRCLDPRFARQIPLRDQHVDPIYRLLTSLGAPETCFVMGQSTLDGQAVPLHKALEELAGVSFGDFISCIPGKLAYFGGEGPNERYILER